MIHRVVLWFQRPQWKLISAWLLVTRLQSLIKLVLLIAQRAKAAGISSVVFDRAWQ